MKREASLPLWTAGNRARKRIKETKECCELYRREKETQEVGPEEKGEEREEEAGVHQAWGCGCHSQGPWEPFKVKFCPFPRGPGGLGF